MNRLSTIRRWGVATLTGVTLFGGLSIVGAGVASAAGVTSFASATPTDAVAYHSTTWTETFTPATALAAGDTITFVALPGTGSAVTSPTVAITGNTVCTAVSTWTESTSTLVVALGNVTGQTCAVAASTQSFTVTLVNPYAQTGHPTLSTSKDTTAVPTTAATVITANTAVASTPTSDRTLAAGSGSYTTTLTPKLPAGANASAFPFIYTLNSSVNGCLALSGTGVITVTCSSLTAGTTYTVNYSIADGQTDTGSGSFSLSVDALAQAAPFSAQVSPSASSTFAAQLAVTGATGAVTYTQSTGQPSLTVSATGKVTTTGNAALVQGIYTTSGSFSDSSTPAKTGTFKFTLVVSNNNGSIYGQTADNTAAATYENQVANYTHNNVTGCQGSTSSQNTVVLATDAFGSTDPMAAATLEGALNLQGKSGNPVGLLITSPTSLDASMLQALSAEGVTSVYVVGGPLAISPADLALLAATPATGCGSTARGAAAQNIQVFGPFYGQTADETALAIDNEANAINPFSTAPAFVSLAGVTSTTYNDTAQTGSSAGINAATGTTAIVVADNDVQDSAAIAGVAYKYELPILVTPGQSATLGTDAQNGLTRFGIKQVLLLGGQLAIPTSVSASMVSQGIAVVPIAGKDYTDTSDQVAMFETASAGSTTATELGLGWTGTTVLLSQGHQVNDALGAAYSSAVNESPMILTISPIAGLSATDTTELGNLGALGYLTIQGYGGPLALPSATISAATAAL